LRTASLIALGLGALWLNLSARADGNPVERNAPAPELSGGPWINTPDGKPISLAARRGKVTVVHFWTFACSNCRANLPTYARWHKQFSPKDVAIIGVHTPETETEKNEANVRQKIKELGIEWPVLVDRDGANWQRWDQQYWPAIYLLDKKGRIRWVWIGELEFNKAGGEKAMTRRIEQLLAEDAR